MEKLTFSGLGLHWSHAAWISADTAICPASSKKGIRENAANMHAVIIKERMRGSLLGQGHHSAKPKICKKRKATRESL